MSSLIEPIYFGQVRRQPVRFFAGPTSSPELPWHCHDELLDALALNTRQRAIVRQMLQNGPFKGQTRTIATRSGITIIAPHFMAQGFIRALHGEDSMTEDDYCEAMTKASKVLTAGMSEQARMSFLFSAATGKDVQTELIGL